MIWLAIGGIHALGYLGPKLGHVGALPTATLEHSNGHTTASETSRSWPCKATRDILLHFNHQRPR